MKLLISALFIIATTLSAMHEHIAHEHNSSTCQICIVDNHSVSGDIVDDFTEVEIVKFCQISPILLVKLFFVKDYSYEARAPPFNS